MWSIIIMVKKGGGVSLDYFVLDHTVIPNTIPIIDLSYKLSKQNKFEQNINQTWFQCMELKEMHNSLKKILVEPNIL